MPGPRSDARMKDKGPFWAYPFGDRCLFAARLFGVVSSRKHIKPRPIAVEPAGRIGRSPWKYGRFTDRITIAVWVACRVVMPAILLCGDLPNRFASKGVRMTGVLEVNSES